MARAIVNRTSLIVRAMPGSPRRMGERGEAVVEAIGVIGRGGNAGVGAGHHRGDGEHRRGEKVDVVHV